MRRGSLAIEPVFLVSNAGSFAGLTIDNVRITVVRPPSDTIARQTFPFAADSDTLRAGLTVDIIGNSEQLVAIVEMMVGAQVLFTGSQTVTVTAGPGSGSSPAQVPLSFVGPGAGIASINMSPRDSGITQGARIQFRAAPRDSQNVAVAQFYLSWSSSDPAHVIDHNGMLQAGNTRGTFWVRAWTPTGVRDSTRFTVSPLPTAVQIQSGSGQTASVGAALALPLVARVIAADNGPVAGVPVNFAVATGGGSVTPAVAVTDSLGLASASATLGALVGTQSFTATVAGLSAVTFTSTAISASASALAFGVQPGTTVAGTAMAPAVQVRAQDGAGNLVTSFTGPVTVALGANPAGGTLSGTLTVNAVGGVASFSDLSINLAGAGYTLAASAPGLSGATSNPFTINAGAAAAIAIASGNSQAGAPLTQLPLPLAAKVTDGLGNGVSGVAVAFAVASGGGSVATPSATTDAAGLASTTWTLGPGLGTQTVTATAAGLTGSPLTFTGTATAGGTTTVSPRLDTLTALNETVTLTAQLRDSANTPIAGSFTWVSRNPSIVTVNGSGLVTAVANGQAYVVATEAGGTRDSALIVVQQRIATINVSPGNRTIYLTRNFTFTAVAVDGLGSPMPGTTNFTWSSTAPAVATVDTAGVVTAVGLGSAQIRATSGSVTGVALVNVITPITRIAVVVDTAGANVTDTFTMTSLGLSRRYRAIAYDTLDVVMPGVSFTWQSTNGSVAVLDSITATTARATGAANGLTRIVATAQGFSSAPGASLTVAQVLASIELRPLTATIAVTGSVALTARGKDANNRYISGGTFSFASSATAIATVSTAGVVTGVANGSADITASSGAVTSNVATVTVGGAVPPVISFGRDTLSVGRGSSTSIPILLSTPAASPLTVNLAVVDTVAFWSTASVTIPAGATSINATLNGRNAGTTTVTAVDGSGLGYSGASAVLAVTATMRLASGGYAINATDIVQTQVLLSDPSPAGGTYVTFGYSTPGIAAISPDPAFIPAGQLAADIQIRGLAAGSTNITPSAIGVNGTPSSFTAYAPVLTASTGFVRLGQGQYESGHYVYTPTYTNVPVTVTLTSSDTTVATVTPSVTIPGGSYYAYFTVSAKAAGSATISYSAPGWTASATMTVSSTAPALSVCCGTTLFTTSPAQNTTVYVTDSLGTAHYRTNSLVVRLASSDTTVLKVLDSVVTVAPGQYYSSAGRVVPAGLGGTAWLIATASGHRSDSTQYVVNGPPLSLSWTSSRMGAGQEDQMYVSVPNNVTSPLVVNLGNSDSNVVGTPPSVTIPVGTYYAYFTLRGKATGSVSIVASAPGYNPDTAGYTVTTPGLTSCCNYTFNNFGPGANITVYSTDSLGTAHYRTAALAVSVVSDNPAVATVDSSTVTILGGQYYSSAARVTPVGIGTARIIFSAAGHTTRDTLTITVNTPKLQFSFNTANLGRRQQFAPTDLYVYTPDNRTTPLALTITQTSAAVETLTTLSPTIPAGQYYAYFGAHGLSTGSDTLIVSAPGYLPDTAVIRVTTPRFTACCVPSSGTTTNPPFGVTVYAADSLQTAHYVSDTLVVMVTSSDTTVLRPVQPYFRILKGNYFATTTVNIVGPGTASLTFTDSAATGYLPVTTGSMTVTGPALAISNSTPVLGMRQTGGASGAYVYVPNNVVTPLVVNLVSTDSRVVSVPASVTIPAGSYYAYFPITGLDTLGTIQVQATATGYTAASTNVQVTQPKFVLSTSTTMNTTSSPATITVYAADANGTVHFTTEDVTVTLLSSAPSVANIDSTTVTIVAGAYFTQAARWAPGLVGTAQLSAQDQRAALYKYTDGTVNVAVVTPGLSFSYSTSTLGIGQYDDVYVYRPDATASSLNVGLAHVGTARTSTLVSGAPVSSVTIPAASNYGNFRLVGTQAGVDTLVGTASSPAHRPDTAYATVGQGRIDPIQGLPSSMIVGDSVQLVLYARDQNTGTHYVLANTTYTLAPNANIQFVSGGSSSAVITQVTIPADQYYVIFYVKAVSAGTGTATISATNYTTYNATITVNP